MTLFTRLWSSKAAFFSGKTSTHMFDVFSGGGHGVAFADYGKSWKLLRAFGMKTLRGFGVGRKSMEERIMEEICHLTHAIEQQNGKPFNCKIAISNALSNIICSITMGSRFSYDDKRFVEIVERLNKISSDKLDGTIFGILVFFPLLRYLPVFWTSYNRIHNNLIQIRRVMLEIIEDHKERFDENDIRDFIDEFLRETKLKTSDESVFNEKQLLHNVLDLFSAGTETSSSTLRWCILGFAHFPDCQSRIAEEVQKVIGLNGIPTMDHRERMPYTRAFVQEVMRHRTMLPLALPHKTTSNTSVNGYDIPKETPIMPNIWSVHFDAEYFGDPEKFRPERFIKSGEFIPCNHVIPFSVGPRICLGEQLARMELFLFVTSIVQKFKIIPDSNHRLPNFSDGLFGVVYGSHDFSVRFLIR
ncbi:cytochrome P450 2J6-like [Styela clava]